MTDKLGDEVRAEAVNALMYVISDQQVTEDAIDALTPIIAAAVRAEAIEEAAKVDKMLLDTIDGLSYVDDASDAIEVAMMTITELQEIRALSVPTPTEETK